MQLLLISTLCADLRFRSETWKCYRGFSQHLFLSKQQLSCRLSLSPPQQRRMGRSSLPGLSNGREAQGWEPPIGSPHDRSAGWLIGYGPHWRQSNKTKASSVNGKTHTFVFPVTFLGRQWTHQKHSLTRVPLSVLLTPLSNTHIHTNFHTTSLITNL